MTANEVSYYVHIIHYFQSILYSFLLLKERYTQTVSESDIQLHLLTILSHFKILSLLRSSLLKIEKVSIFYYKRKKVILLSWY